MHPSFEIQMGFFLPLAIILHDIVSSQINPYNPQKARYGPAPSSDLNAGNVLNIQLKIRF